MAPELTSRSLTSKYDEEKIAPLKIVLTVSGPMAAEVRRICKNLDINQSVFARKAIKGELRAMGIMVD